MNFTLNRDGSLDICAGGIRLSGGYPAIDGIPVRPLRVEACGNHARFELDGGSIELDISELPGGVAIACRAAGLPGAHDISPFANAAVTGCTQGFR